MDTNNKIDFDEQLEILLQELTRKIDQLKTHNSSVDNFQDNNISRFIEIAEQEIAGAKDILNKHQNTGKGSMSLKKQTVIENLKDLQDKCNEFLSQ